MNPDSLAFLQTLFARVSVGAIALTALPVGQGKTLTCHVPCTEKGLLAKALDRLQAINTAGMVSALVGVATRRVGLSRYHRGRRADLLELPAFCADLDRPPADTYPLLARFTPPPSLMVASGFGTHVYWLLQTPVSPDEQCDQLLQGLAAALGGDRVTTAQSMRLPGTVNVKRGRDNAPCHLLESHLERLYGLSDFAGYLPRERPVHSSHLAAGTYLRDLAGAIADMLMADYGGHPKNDGWIGALCPAGHVSDYPGKHFYFNPDLRMGHCFGRHGRLLLKDLSFLMNLPFQQKGRG